MGSSDVWDGEMQEEAAQLAEQDYIFWAKVLKEANIQPID